MAVNGSQAPADSVVYELFVAKTEAVRGNWLASCGMYHDAFVLETAQKISLPGDRLSHSVELEFEGDSGYRRASLSARDPCMRAHKHSHFSLLVVGLRNDTEAEGLQPVAVNYSAGSD